MWVGQVLPDNVAMLLGKRACTPSRRSQIVSFRSIQNAEGILRRLKRDVDSVRAEMEELTQFYEAVVI